MSNHKILYASLLAYATPQSLQIVINKTTLKKKTWFICLIYY